jgi:cytochrome c5
MAKSLLRGALVLSAGTVLAALVVAGCQAITSPDSRAATTSATPAAAKAEKGGAELWSDTCGHCHNLRSPSTYGPAQWEVVVYDMRVRAHLTGEEQRKITEFLKAASQ